MSISSNGRFIADTRLSRVSGFKVAGGYGVRLGVDFTSGSWDLSIGDCPVVVIHPVVVQLDGLVPMKLGRAFPETPMPFSVTPYGMGPTGAGFELVLSRPALEEIEKTRNGEGVALSAWVQAEVRRGSSVDIVNDQLRQTFNQSDWLAVLDGCGYQRTMLFEIPLPQAPSDDEHWARALETARRHFLAGHYPEAVAACRAVLEALNRQLNQVAEVKDAVEQHKKQRKDLTVVQRELIVRQAAFDFASPAVHTDNGVPEDLYDRASAQMLLSITASVVSAALVRIADRERSQG